MLVAGSVRISEDEGRLVHLGYFCNSQGGCFLQNLQNEIYRSIVDGRKPANHLRLLVYPRYFKTSINRPESPRGASVH